MSVRRGSFVSAATLAALAGTVPASAAADGTLWHVAIFHFEPQDVARAVDGFRAMRRATRRHAGNLAYDVIRSADDPGAFVIVERWASTAALRAHERTPIFTAVGRDVLERYAVLHDTITGTPLAG